VVVIMMMLVMTMGIMPVRVTMAVGRMIRRAKRCDIAARLVRQQGRDAGEQEAKQRKEDDGCIHGLCLCRAHVFNAKPGAIFAKHARQPFIMLMSSTAIEPRLR
jgi:hypothetical protein